MPLKELLYKIFFPSFDYFFTVSHVSSSFIRNIESRLPELGGDVVSRSQDNIVFKVPTSQIFGMWSFHTTTISVAKQGDNYKVYISTPSTFRYEKIVVPAFCILLTTMAALTKNSNLLGIAVILFILMHINSKFHQSYQTIQSFIVNLDE